MEEQLLSLQASLEGELYWDHAMRVIYATDASAYRELPLAVAIPRTEEDIQRLIAFAHRHHTALIPRTAGTSLAGQVVGAGIIVDVSLNFTEILELNVEQQWVRVQPGVIRDALNRFLAPHGLYFGPETSTANRAMIGGMVGNNSCGSNSLVYGSTREHTLSVTGFLSDGSKVVFEDLSFDDFIAKGELDNFEGSLYRHLRTLLSDYRRQESIRQAYPKPTILRRNTGYAIDMLLESDPFTVGAPPFNFSKLICGSEGTLLFITEIKLHVDLLPQHTTGLLCVHFETLDDALRANLIALQHSPLVSELMDDYILACTLNNMEQAQNRFFVEGDPRAILIIEYAGQNEEEVRQKAALVEHDMRSKGYGYSFPLVMGADKTKVWNLRKAGLGLLSNTPGDAKPVAVIEDTAVDVQDLPAYIQEFNHILQQHKLYSVHYAHAATGELHLRPILNLKTLSGQQQFRAIALDIAHLVKKYKGSLSGEHGDGRLRGEFIALMIGEENYQMLRALKHTWDPQGIFNPGKIVDTPAMDSFLRYAPEQHTPAIPTVFRYGEQSILQHAEQCNGSGDCRKTASSGGTMCPSYMATRQEKDTTRARANMLREFFTHSGQHNPYSHQEVKEVLDLCLSCKACKSECPSSVDMAKLKADFLQGYYDVHGIPLRARLIGEVDRITAMAAKVPRLYNWLIDQPQTSAWIKGMLGFAPQRPLPRVAHTSLKQWYRRRRTPLSPTAGRRQVYFFCDEFTNFNDVAIGKKAILLLEGLGYEVLMIDHAFSGRALISKGLLRKAKVLANENVRLFSGLISDAIPLVGVEPSTILTFRDEYVDLVDLALREQALAIAPHAMMVEEFICREHQRGHIRAESFTPRPKHLLFHGHCQQKAWNMQQYSVAALRIPSAFSVQEIPSGCCGMAGSFGYEREHYSLSMQIGELVLFPAVRQKAAEQLVVAPGSSCRHQIQDGTKTAALHPVEVLYEALR